ncbi:hypothetical protein F5X98DRAFT_260495 [Xylaria grammica]|nr:hypothetical protein F5X98DRAFT_260495 [Xylaria grammica]
MAMDLTSMLNTASAVPGTSETTGCFNPASVILTDGNGVTPRPSVNTTPLETSAARPVGEERPPSYSKKPWDAGGYTMPPSGDLGLTPAQAQPSSYQHLQPASQKHKISDSYSSLSSYESPSTLPHSRISSISTAGDIQTTDLAPKASSLEPGWEDLGCVPSTETREKKSIQEFTRLESPSDAMLISKASGPFDHISTRDTTSKEEAISNWVVVTSPELSARAHKRTVSAPDTQGANTLRQPYCSLPPDCQPPTPTPQSSQPAPASIMESPALSATTDSSIQDSSGLSRCMYITNCDTGSSLRKVVSHIFGRNKLCTRMIPDHVWVHFCRKHYQRSRYRNPQEYAKLQCELVRQQINRVQEWSDNNVEKGQTGVVQNWTLSMRKREQNRVEDQAKKRRHSDISDENKSNHPKSPGKRDTNPVPDWLRRMCGQGFTTAGILDVVNRIMHAISQEKMHGIPDVEILPNIPTNGVEVAKPKPSRRGTVTSTTHKRAQSLNVTRGGESQPSMMRRPDPVPYWQHMTPPGFPSTDKRQRMMEGATLYNHAPCIPTSDVQGLDPRLRPTRDLPYRTTFPREPLIQESRAEEPYCGSQAAGGPHYTYSRSRLPTLTPSHPADVPMPAQPEPNAPGPIRLTHQRSVSEYVEHSSSMRSGYQMGGQLPPDSLTPFYSEPRYQPAPSPTHNFHPMSMQSFPLLTESVCPPSSTYLQQPFDRSRHSRHQSTPNAAPLAHPHPQAHPYGSSNASYQVYGRPNDSGHAFPTPNTPFRYTPRQAGPYVVQPGVQQPEKTSSPYPNIPPSSTA